eukprot:953646-Prorocentrum_minimum.AAC.1
MWQLTLRACGLTLFACGFTLQVVVKKKALGDSSAIQKVIMAKSFFGDRELLSGQSDDMYIAGKG